MMSDLGDRIGALEDAVTRMGQHRFDRVKLDPPEGFKMPEPEPEPAPEPAAEAEAPVEDAQTE